MEPKSSWPQSQALTLWLFRNMRGFHGEELLVPRPNPKLEDHLLSAARYCLFIIFTATLHILGCSPNRNPRTRHAVLPGTHLPQFAIKHLTDSAPN
jgi:hypothetical protein